MRPPVFFDTIIVKTPCAQVYRRLGYRRGATRVPPPREAEVKKYIGDGLSPRATRNLAEAETFLMNFLRECSARHH